MLLGQIVTVEGAAAIVMLSGLVKTFSAPSVTFGVKVKIPTVVGAPVIAPVLGFERVSPGGSPVPDPGQSTNYKARSLHLRLASPSS